MIKLCFVPEILVFVREMSLKFYFWGRHACRRALGQQYCTDLLIAPDSKITRV